jgi:hypothetical protein
LSIRSLGLIDLAFAVVLAAGLEGQQRCVPREPPEVLPASLFTVNALTVIDDGTG